MSNVLGTPTSIIHSGWGEGETRLQIFVQYGLFGGSGGPGGVGTCEQSMIQVTYLAISLRLRSSDCRAWEGCAAPGLGEVSEPELSMGLGISAALPLSRASPAALRWVPGLISHRRELKECHQVGR